MRGLAASIGLIFTLGLASSAANAGPEAKLRVRGSTRIEARIIAAEPGPMLQGTLFEEVSRPVASARVAIRRTAIDGTPGKLGPVQSCQPGLHPSAWEREGEDEVLALTDPAGHFCLRLPLDLTEGRLHIAFRDPHSLLDASQKVVEIGGASAIAIDFSPRPQSLSLDRAETSITLTARARPGVSAEQLVLSWLRQNQPPVVLFEGAVIPGDALAVRFPSHRLGSPGPGELSARLGSGTDAAESRASLLVTAQAKLRVPALVKLDRNRGGTLVVDLESVAGPVDSGSTEVLLAGRTLGIAPVQQGRSSVELNLSWTPLAGTAEVRYLPASPWWLPGARHSVELSIDQPSSWSALAWAVALAAIAGWMITAWRRPPGREGRHIDSRVMAPPGDAVCWVGPVPTLCGWTGRVTDAHDGQPLARVLVSIESSDGTRKSVLTAADGAFILASPAGELSGAQIRVDGPWHSPICRPAPPLGDVAIKLVTRRRTLLARLIDWARTRGGQSGSDADPTPREIARAAEGASEGAAARWARAVEDAAFGPVAVDQTEEARIQSLEPKD